MSNTLELKEINLKTAEEMYDLFSPTTGIFSKDLASRRWLFRGLPDSTYKLIPTALRDGSQELMNRIAGRECVPNYDSTAIQLYYEFNVLAKFYSEVDMQGLPVADDAPELRPFLYRPTTSALSYLQQLLQNEQRWPPKSLYGLAALAQHHGLPTRLLDWSLDPYIACFFACQPHNTSNAELAIWAVDSYAIERSAGAVEIVTAPAASNPNLHAQRGVFTVNPISLNNENAFGSLQIQSVDELLNSVRSIESPLMYKILMPRSESTKLLSIINRIGYKPSTLFPGYEGAAKTVLGSPITCKLVNDNWKSRITMLIPESEVHVAKVVSALIDPFTEGSKTFDSCFEKIEGGHRYRAMSTVAPIEASSFFRQIAEGIKGAIFFFQNEDILVDTNSELDCGISYQPRDLLDKVGFRSI